jgi:hypothetical protein
MNRICAVVITILASTMAWAQQPARTQDNAAKAVPVEFFACKWVAGKGMKDLDVVKEKFRQWTMKHDRSYSAWTMTPQFHNGQGMFDVGWLGSWPSGTAFGVGQDAWMTQGREMAAAFDGVIDCSARHELASSMIVEAPDGPPGDGVVMFAQCTLKDGKSLDEALRASKQLAATLKALGSKARSWLFYPGLGAGDIDFHFWRVVAFNNYTELGAAAEIVTNGGGAQKTREILGPVATCSSPSVFDARQVVAGQTTN